MNEENNFQKIAKIILYVLATLLPLWIIPLPIGVELGREVTFSTLIILAAIFWLLSILTTGEFRFYTSPVLYGAGFFLLTLTASSFLSKSPGFSVFWTDPAGEKLITVILGMILMLVAGGVFRKKSEAGSLVLILIFAGATSAIINSVQLLLNKSVYQYLNPLAQGTIFNPIGTQNSLVLFYVVLLAMTLGAFTAAPLGKWRGWVKYLLITSILVFLLNLLIINFQTSWIILLGISVFLFGLSMLKTPVFGSFNETEEGLSSETETRVFGWREWLAMAFTVLSLVMLLVKTPLFKNISLPAEVAPSFRGTLNIAKEVFREGPRSVFFGSGPGTFGLDWSKYKDPAINQTIFWNLRFNQGSSWFSTLIPTTGILGIISFVVLVGAGLFLFLKQIFTARGEETVFARGIFLGFVSLVLTSLFYPANPSMVLLLFWVTGLGAFCLSMPSRIQGNPSVLLQDDLSGQTSAEFLTPHNDEESGEAFETNFWGIVEKRVKFTSPWAVFLSSLVIIFLIAMGVTGLFQEFIKTKSALAFQKGINFLNRGDLDKSLTEFERVVSWDEDDFRGYQVLVQIRTEKIKHLIQRASSGENVQQEFQTIVAAAIQNSKRSIELYPADPLFWKSQGALYELIIPFIPGSEGFAFESYRKAIELEPINPAGWVDLGRAGLIYAERLRFAENQANAAGEKEQIGKIRIDVLRESAKAFQRATEIKSDFAPAHFLLAQTAIRLGNTQAAIASTENAKLTAPFDIGIAFQLGLLYYQNKDSVRAQAEFERAVSLNTNYSNARYFLGLIYDRKGERIKAIEHFEKVLELNPDNGEVKKILTNLYDEKSALAEIVPPAEPPEKRKSAPVEEKIKKSPKSY